MRISRKNIIGSTIQDGTETVKGFEFQTRNQILTIKYSPDYWILNEVINKDVYKIIPHPDDVVLDIGGFIGSFTVPISKQVKQVITYEPASDNYDLLKRNVAVNKCQNVGLVKAAIVGSEGRMVVRSLLKNDFPYAYSFLMTRSASTGLEDVVCENINDVLARYEPTILKVDVEGLEIEILLAIRDFSKITQLSFEFHKRIAKRCGLSFDKLIAHLRPHFDSIKWVEDTDWMMYRDFVVVCKKSSAFKDVPVSRPRSLTDNYSEPVFA